MTLAAGTRLGPYEILAPLYPSLSWLTIDPNFDPLCKNPRFHKLVAGGG